MMWRGWRFYAGLVVLLLLCGAGLTWAQTVYPQDWCYPSRTVIVTLEDGATLSLRSWFDATDEPIGPVEIVLYGGSGVTRAIAYSSDTDALLAAVEQLISIRETPLPPVCSPDGSGGQPGPAAEQELRRPCGSRSVSCDTFVTRQGRRLCEAAVEIIPECPEVQP